jgi:dTDP-4-dehydrorhamnose reductase
MKILVLGDGLLGSELVKQTGWDYISRKKDGFDITKSEKFSFYLIDNYDGVAFFPKYNCVINCIAYTDTYSNNKDLHWDVNYKAVVELSNFCKENKIKLVHISTDYVYTNSISEASEDDIPIHGNNWYSYTKLLGDSYVQLNPNNLILRGTHKKYPFSHSKAWIDQVGNFDYTNVIAYFIIRLTNMKASGLFNLGTNLKSMYELALAYKSPSEVEAALSPSFAPKNVSMDISKLKNVIKGNNQ